MQKKTYTKRKKKSAPRRKAKTAKSEKKIHQLKVCFAASECVPFVKTGGLADVCGALPIELAKLGCEVKVFVPLYGSIKTIDHGLSYSSDLTDMAAQIGDLTVPFHTWHKKDLSGVEFHFVDCPHYFHRDKIYTSDPDEDERFFLFQNAVITIMQHYNWSPDILHCNDWQTALLPVFIKEKFAWDSLFQHTGCVLSIHNIKHQGRSSENSIYKAGLKYDNYYPTGPLEYHDSFSTLKAGIFFSETITTVSPTYAQELLTEEYGEGFDGILRSRQDHLVGILNGIDNVAWNPATDILIPQNYTFKTFEKKRKNRQALLEFAHLPYDENAPVIGLIARLDEQKGIDLLTPVFNELLDLPVQFVVLGSGEKKYEDFFSWASHNFRKNAYAYIGFNNELAHLITAGSDMYLMPSRFEPCGLNQMYSLNYGTVPIVRKTGGLADTVRDFHEFDSQGNGFSFHDYTPYALGTSVQRAVELFHKKETWMQIVERGMTENFSWQASARKYLQVYERAKEMRG
ncbi:MAG: glycogen synthase [bacterium]